MKGEPPSCLVCSSPASRLRYRITRFQIRECEECDQIYLWPLLDEEAIRDLFAQLYTTGEGSVAELKRYYEFCFDDSPSNPLVQLYESWLDEIERHRAPGNLLDVGCGTGLFLATARRRGWTAFGIDECEPAIRYAREHFGLDVWVGDFADFTSESRRFDVITGWDIIEHAREPIALLAAMRGYLARDGLVALSTPNQSSILDVAAGALYRVTGGRLTTPLEKFYIEQHFLYFTEMTLANALQRAGLASTFTKRELTDLRRLTLAPSARLVLQVLFAAARLSGLENRLFCLARAL